MPATRTLRVTLPAHQHVRLHSLKILDGVEISVAVDAALRAYFEKRAPILDAETRAAARGAAARGA